jgi:uncharacterized protein YjiS (DUF1127 family)
MMEMTMPTFAVPVESEARSRSAPLLRIWTFSARILLWPVRFYRARQEFAVLAGLSDHDLKDIGLTRTDIANVTALPRDVDPTTALSRVVAERRSHRA